MQPLAILWFSFAAVAVSWVGDVGGVSTSYLEVQLTGLEALYNATSGEQWTFSRGWKDATLGICGWYGVMCDSRGQNATALLLASNGLAGNLNEAAELFEILSLVKVDLSDNELVGPVPLGLGLMPGLEVLDLSRNQLSSFPTSWGAEAYTLRHLSLQLNNISGPLPSAWLNVRSSTSYPLVHSKEVSSWLPELRTLALGGNAISMPVYHALQAVIGFASLQVLDLSSNALHGRIDQSFEQHYCGGGSLDACDSIAIKAGASILAITLLASNLIEGELEANSLPKSMSVLTISDNLLNGSVPEDYAQLSVFMADGNEWLQHTSLPGFASYANSSTIVTKHQNLSCPVISGKHAAGRSVRLSLDPSYLSYSHCVCIEGMEGNAQDGCQACPEGTYRGTAELFVTRSCISCPANSWSMATGAESVSECKCQAGFYDTLGGVGDEDGAPSCVACPYDNGAWDSAGAINVATCSCPAGRYLDEAARTCSECDAGTYKTSVGNDVRLCVPCARGTYSPQRGRTNSEACIPCEAGTFSPTSGAASSSTCLPCPRGTYSSKVGLFSAELCARCPAGYYLEGEGAMTLDACLPCAKGRFLAEVGASSSGSCEPCPDGFSSLGGSHECETLTANSLRGMVIYLVVGGSTLAGICLAYYTWSKKVHKWKKLVVDSRTETPLKMTEAKRKAHVWAVFFHTLETIDVITGNALFGYLLDIGAIQGLMQYIYWLVVSLGVALNVFRLYMILKHLQINKFKVQLAVIMDLPLTVLNLWLLWRVDPQLIKSALFLTSLIIAVFSAGKISTLIEYHLELRQRKRKLERLLLLELRENGDEDNEIVEDINSEDDEEDDCFEHGDPATLLKFHGMSMRNIPTGAEDAPTPRRKNWRYLTPSPTRPAKDRGARRSGGAIGSGEGRSPSPLQRLSVAESPRRSQPMGYTTLPQEEGSN